MFGGEYGLCDWEMILGDSTKKGHKMKMKGGKERHREKQWQRNRDSERMRG